MLQSFWAKSKDANACGDGLQKLLLETEAL
jgi:hypothetical protein